MLKRLYHWTLAKAGHPLAERWLAFIAFIESSLFPIPPDVVLAPMCLARPDKAMRYAAICTAGSTVGAGLGWVIGAVLFESVGRWVLSVYGVEAEYMEIAHRFNEDGWLIVMLAGFTPIPFKVVTIASGATGLSIYVLLAASVISRGARFFLVGGLLKLFGEPMKRTIDRHFGLITFAFAALLIGGFAAIKWLI